MRALLEATIQDAAGNVLQNALVNVYEQGTTTPVGDMFAAPSGGSPVATLTSDSHGLVSGWFTSARVVDLVVTDNSSSAFRPSAPAALLSWVDYTLTVAVNLDPATVVLSTDARLSDARPPTGAAGGVLGGTYPNPSFAADMATQVELDAEASNRVAGDAASVSTAAADATSKAAAAQAAAIAASQPVDSDLSAIAALSTTSYGRAFLALADAAAGRTALGLGTAATTASTAYDAAGAAAAAQAASQPLDSDLTAIAALSTTSYGRAFLALANAAAGRTALGLDAVYAALGGATFTGAVAVPDDPYDATSWNGSVQVPTKNAVRDKIETLGAGALPQSAEVAYVDYVNGNDANNGLSASSAFKTIQAAYNALRTYAEANYSDAGKGLGVGTLYLLPGQHNVGAGVVTPNNRPVKVVGTRQGSVTHNPSLNASVIMTTSATATELWKVTSTSGVLGYGTEFHEVFFRFDQTVATALTKCIYAQRVGNFVVDHCSFDTADSSTNVSVTAIYQEDLNSSSGEGGWIRVVGNNCSRMQLYQCVSVNGSGTIQASGGNFNRGRIMDNVVFYGGSLAMVQFNGDTNGYLVDNNNLEGAAVGVELGPNGHFTNNNFINNSGEEPATPTNPFYWVNASCSQQIFIGGICSCDDGTSNGEWIRFDNASAYNNLVIGPYDTTGVAGFKRKIVDNSTSNGNRIINLNSGYLQKYKSGAGAQAITDSDFAPAPMNGTTAVSVNTTSGEVKLWMRANGTWSAISTLSSYTPPVTTKGDLFGFSTVAARIPIGSDTQVLTADAAQTLGLKWAAVPTDTTRVPILTPTAVKTANYTAAASDYVLADTSGGAFTVTLPTAPADKTIIAVELITAGSALTIARGGTDVFNKASGATSLTVTTAQRSLYLQYQSSIGVWHVQDHTPALLTTKGDVLTYGTGLARLGVGTDGQALVADSAQTLGIKWATVSGAGAVASDTIWDTKGDLAVGTGADTAAKLVVGSNGQVLTADSTQTTGTKWATPASGESFVARTTDSTITASTTLTSDSTLLFAIGASATEIWFFNALLLVNAANTAMDFKMGVLLPASASSSWGNGDVAGASVNPGFYSVAVGTSPQNPLASGGVLTLGTASGQLMIRAAGWVFGGGTAGNVVLQFAQNTSDAGNLVIKKGSHIRYQQLVA